jgi:hypothetical protein
MTVSGTDGLSEKKFRQRRAHWLEIRAGNLAAVLETAGLRVGSDREVGRRER